MSTFGWAILRGILGNFGTESTERALPDRIRTVRSDSAAYNHEVINDYFACDRLFSITADLNEAV